VLFTHACSEMLEHCPFVRLKMHPSYGCIFLTPHLRMFIAFLRKCLHSTFLPENLFTNLASSCAIQLPARSRSNFKNSVFTELRADNLQTNRKLFLRIAAWQAQRRNTGTAHGNRKHIGHIHRQRIVLLFADPKSRERRNRSHDHINILERVIKILADERPNLLGPNIVRIIIPAEST